MPPSRDCLLTRTPIAGCGTRTAERQAELCTALQSAVASLSRKIYAIPSKRDPRLVVCTAVRLERDAYEAASSTSAAAN